MKPTQSKTKTRTKAGRTASLRCNAIVRKQPAPDVDYEALKACCLAINSCSSGRMRKATIDFLVSKYAPSGVS